MKYFFSKVKEASGFYLVGLMVGAMALVLSLVEYVREISRDGWLNPYGILSIIFVFILWYFMRNLDRHGQTGDSDLRSRR